MDENILEAKNLHYTYEDGTCALSGVNMTVKKGKTTAVLGGNGAGKSTLFLNFNGILKPSAGEVLFKGNSLAYARKELKELRRSVGIVFQDSDSQLFSASVYQDISFGAVNLKLPEEEVKRRVDAAIERMGIADLKDKPTHCLSHGQKKRVALAGVLVMEPEVLVLDELTAGLDPIGVSEIMELLKTAQKELGLTVILSTHDIDIVPLYCDYIYVLDNGKILLEGVPQEVFKHTDEIRKHGLRLPRIGHLIEILRKKDGFLFESSAYTISEARKAFKSIMPQNINSENTNENSEKTDAYVIKAGKKLRTGYTTGSCAAAAAKAGALMLFEQREIKKVQITLPQGKELGIEVLDPVIDENEVSCCVVKDAGDDPDVTDGIKVYAKIKKTECGISIDGGIGVGRVAGVGLPCKTGEAAINPGPKKMINEALRDAARLYGYEGGFAVEIYVPQGQEIAKKTFNERLGIIGGISILGTTGIVEPMSESALIQTIKLELEIKKQKGQKVLLISPGNYGLEFVRTNLGFDINSAVKCSNYIGEALDHALYLGFERLLLVGHIGKLVKIAAGVMNTHSKIADCRNEIFASHGALAGADRDTVGQIMQAKTTNEIHGILTQRNIAKDVYQSIMEKVEFHLNYRVKNQIQAGIISFSNEHGVLFQTENAGQLIEELRGI